MRKYIAELHTKPVHHKKRFALLVAGSVTIIILAFWSTIKFSAPAAVATDSNVGNLAAPAAAVTPFGNILSGIKSSWDSIVDITHGR